LDLGIRVRDVDRLAAAADHAPRGEQAVAREEDDARPARGVEEPRHLLDDDAEAADARRDEHDVAREADEREHDRVAPAVACMADPLAEEEDVLRAGGDDEREAQAEPGEQSGEHVVHASPGRAKIKSRCGSSKVGEATLMWISPELAETVAAII